MRDETVKKKNCKAPPHFLGRLSYLLFPWPVLSSMPLSKLALNTASCRKPSLVNWPDSSILLLTATAIDWTLPLEACLIVLWKCSYPSCVLWFGYLSLCQRLGPQDGIIGRWILEGGPLAIRARALEGSSYQTCCFLSYPVTPSPWAIHTLIKTQTNGAIWSCTRTPRTMS